MDPIRRRELFQLGAAAGAMVLGTSGVPRTVKAARVTGFRVEIRPGPPVNPGVSIELDPVVFRPRRKTPGPHVPGIMTARIPDTPGHEATINDVRDWVKSAFEGTCVRKDITIEIFDQANGAPLRTFNLLECFPVHLSPTNVDSDSSSDVLHWVLEVRVNRIEMS